MNRSGENTTFTSIHLHTASRVRNGPLDTRMAHSLSHPLPSHSITPKSLAPFVLPLCTCIGSLHILEEKEKKERWKERLKGRRKTSTRTEKKKKSTSELFPLRVTWRRRRAGRMAGEKERKNPTTNPTHRSVSLTTDQGPSAWHLEKRKQKRKDEILQIYEDTLTSKRKITNK